MDSTLHPVHDRVVASMFGLAIGDAMGGPVEALTPAQIVEKYSVVDRFLPYPSDHPPSFHGSFSSRAGDYTDDTRLAKLICAGLVASGGLPAAGDIDRIICGTYFSTESPLEKGFLEEYALKAIYGADKESFGGKTTNGAIMAIAPMGVLFPGDPHRTFDTAFRSLTMATGSARISAAAAAACISAAMIQGNAMEAVGSGLAAAEERLQRMEGTFWHNSAMYSRVGGWALGLARRAVSLGMEYGDPLNDAFRSRLYQEIGQSFFADGDETLALALAMFVAAKGDFKMSVIGAVNYGKDCDSYAAVAGALAGALNGTRSIPSDWVASVESCDSPPKIRDLADSLCAAVMTRINREKNALSLADPEHIPEPSGNGLISAVTDGNESEVLRLLSAGADRNEKGAHGRTALHLACAAGHYSIVKALLLFGDDINKKDMNRTTALHFAAWENHIDIVDLLLDWGAFAEETEGKGWTPLHDSVRREYHDIPLRILAKTRGLRNGDALREELFLLQGEQRFLRLLRLLSEYHVPLDSIGICGHGLLHDAKQRNYGKAVDYLRNKGVPDEA